jgi:hypothetical protein
MRSMPSRPAFIAIAAGLACIASTFAPAGEGAPPLKLGEPVKFSDQKARLTASGWVRSGRGGWGFLVCVEKASEKLRPGEDLEVTARSTKVDGKDRPVDQEGGVYRQIWAGDRVEVEMVEEDKRLRVGSLKLLYQAPRKGTLAGKVIKIDNKEKAEERGWFDLQISATSPGMEHVKGGNARFYIDWFNTGDKSKGRNGWVLHPEQIKVYSTLEEGDLLEVTYKTDGRFRVELPVKKTGHVDVEKKPDPPKHDPKKDPPPEKKPLPKDEDF